MEAIFLKLLNMSIVAGWITLAIIVLRLVFKKAPRAVICALWIVVAIRLILPFSFESDISLVPSVETVPEEIMLQREPQIHTGISSLNSVVNPVISEVFAPEPMTSANPLQIYIAVAANVWVLGIIVMVIYTLFSYLMLHLKTREGVEKEKGIWLCDRIDTPFILGIIRPRIFLPTSMKAEDMEYVISHEKAHLRRLDHIWKPLGFLLLTVYWFNPVMWVAYVLLCRDIELACDEKVISGMEVERKKLYSEALINCSAPRRLVTACPLAFGEVGVKDRVKNVLSYKKPAFWIIICAVLVSVALAVCFLTDPIKPTALDIYNENGYTVISQEKYCFTLSVERALLPDSIYTEEVSFDEGEISAFKTTHTEIYLEKVQPANEGDDKLYFFFNCRYNLAESGKILYPYYKTGESSSYGFGLVNKNLRDNNTVYENAVSVRGQGPDEQIVFYVDTEALKAAEGAIYIDTYLYETEYAKGSHEKAVIYPSEEVGGTKRMTRDDLISLGEKGAALTPEDLEGYIYTEIGSGLYIRAYSIDEMFTLTVGYVDPEEIFYAYLSANDGTGETIDIRYSDVKGFILLHEGNPVVNNKSYPSWLYAVGYSEEAYSKFTEIAGVPEDAYKDSINYLPLKHIDTVDELESFKEAMKNYFAFEKSYADTTTLSEGLSRYDKKFFKSGDLIVIYTGKSASTHRHYLSMSEVNGFLTVVVNELRNDEETTVIDGWLALIEVPKVDIQNTKSIRSFLAEDISVTPENAQKTEMYVTEAENSLERSTICLMNNGRFTMYFSPLSSYFGMGEYVIEDDILTLIADDYDYRYVFKKTGNKLIYDEGASNGPAHYSKLYDGMVFYKSYEHVLTDSEDYH